MKKKTQPNKDIRFWLKLVQFYIERKLPIWFSFSKPKRTLKHFKQVLLRGWSDSETWNLDMTIVDFVLPRLKRFKEIPLGHPSNLTEEEWDAILEKMVKAFELYQNNFHLDKENTDKVDEGLRLFAEYFLSLMELTCRR